MNNAPEPVAGSSPGLASWYVPGRTDGLGERLQMFDRAGAPSLEVLRLHQDLAAAPGFEDRLRDRVRELRSLRHPAFTTVRSVEDLDGDGLAVVSVFEHGQRLSELFDQRSRQPIHPGIVTWLLKELTPALVALHEHGRGIAHGALTPDRIVLSPEGRLCIVEHVLGSALAELHRPPARLWRDFGLLAPPRSKGAAALDQRNDVVQLGTIALAMLLARRVTLTDLTDRLPDLLKQVGSTAGASAQIEPLRAWLSRALQNGSPVYRTAREAMTDLDALQARPSDRAAVLGAANAALPSAITVGLSSRDVSSAAAGVPREPVDAPKAAPENAPSGGFWSRDGFRASTDAFPSERATAGGERALPVAARPSSSAQTSAAPATVPADATSDALTWSTPQTLDPHVAEQAQAGGIRGLGPGLAIGLCVLVLVEAVVIVGLASRPPVAAPPLLTIESSPGDSVLINGQPAGATPLELRVTPDVKSLRIVTGTPDPAEPGEDPPGR